MRGFQTAVATAVSVAVCLTGCGNRGSVTFSIQEPALKSLNPVSDQVTEYALKHIDDSVLAVASQGTGGSDTLPLGPLPASMAPVDLQLQVLSGATLLGMGRIRDVSIENGVQKSYDIAVRKPLLTLGSAFPAESQPAPLLINGEIIDPTQGNSDVTVKGKFELPQHTVATTATWDGRFLLAANDKGMDVLDTGLGQKVGTVPLTFVPVRVAVGARDSAVAVLDPAGTLVIFADIDALTSSPAGATGMKVTLPGAQRTLSFSPDGLSIFVLGGTDADPCSSTAPAKNGITVVGLDGSIKGDWMLPGFVSDLAVDELSNKVVITDASNNKVDTFAADTPFGTVSPQQIGTATCPTAVRTVKGDAFVVTSDRPSGSTDEFVLQRITMATGKTTQIPFVGPVFDENVTDMPSPDMNTSLDFKLRPNRVYAYDLAVTPDGRRASFAIRTRYQEGATQKFQILMESCTPNIDIVEYGLYTIDTQGATAEYTSRSQIVVTPDPALSPSDPASYCVTCKLLGQTDIVMHCISKPGDKAAGLAAIFGGT